MKASVVGILTIWVFVLAPMICAITFDVENATKESYSKFLTTLRNRAKDPKLVYYGIPMLPAYVEDPKGSNYFFVELKATKKKSITLAVSKDNLYVWAYLDKYKGEYRTHFFPDAPLDAKTIVFKKAKLRETIKFVGSYYAALEEHAGTRRDVGLGITKLKSSIENVYGKELNVALEAKFLIIAIQMVAEAARFKYIENQVLANFPYGFHPDYKILTLERRWSTISKAYVNSKDGTFIPALALKDADDKDWTVTKVAEINKDMSLLQYQTS